MALTPYYEQDGVTIYHGDCRDLLPLPEPVDHVITDPPYSRDVYVRAARVTATDKGYSARELKRRGESLRKMGAGEIGVMDDGMRSYVAEAISRITKRWAIVFSDVETCHEWRIELQQRGMRYVRTGVWVKPDAMPQMSGDRPGTGFEPATICHAHGLMRMRWNGGGRPAVWTYGTCKVDRPDHPCPKPEPLMCELVTLFTDPDETILDPFMGSGTTLVAAKRLGRKAIGIELEEKYCEIAAKRLAQGALPMEMGA